jgi:hypothetical protein
LPLIAPLFGTHVLVGHIGVQTARVARCNGEMSKSPNRNSATAGYEPFLKPCTIVEHSESFEVQDSAGRQLAYVYFEDDHTRRDFRKRLTKHDARRMAEQTLRLPELIAIERQFRNR